MCYAVYNEFEFKFKFDANTPHPYSQGRSKRLCGRTSSIVSIVRNQLRYRLALLHLHVFL